MSSMILPRSGLVPPVALVNFFSAGGQSRALSSQNNAKIILSGALTAATYKEILAVSGPGVAQIVWARTVDATARTIGLRVDIDGVTAFDAVSDALATANKGMVAVGSWIENGGANMFVIPQTVAFGKSLSVLVKSSLTETDLVAVGLDYVVGAA